MLNNSVPFMTIVLNLEDCLLEHTTHYHFKNVMQFRHHSLKENSVDQIKLMHDDSILPVNSRPISTNTEKVQR